MKIGWYGTLCGLILSLGVVVLGQTTPPVHAFSARTLIHGSQGDDVYELQNRLKLLGYYWGKVDGRFGWDTYWALRTFQYNFGLKVTGRADMPTKMRLVAVTPNWKYSGNSAGTGNGGNAAGGNSPGGNGAGANSSGTTGSSSVPDQVPSQVNGLSRSDLTLMQHVVYGEARGESFTGEVAIAAVILNRMRDPRFPHKIPAIIYQPGAFTCVQDGQVNLQPDAKAMKAVMDAIHGQDPAMGAVYYFNPATATSPWMWSRPQIIQIGKHIFCR